MSNTLDFSIPEETLSWLSSLPRRPSSNQTSRRGPSRSSTYHESDSKYALRVTHSRRFSLATPPVPPPRLTTTLEEPQEEEKKTSLMDLPNEILDTIVGYAITPSSSNPSEPTITVKRKETEEACTAQDIESGAVVNKWAVSGYPTPLFLVNHTFSAIAFHRVWADSAVDISLTTADSLCFLAYAISERQRMAMRRVRFSKIMLSWSDPVGQDVWLRENAREGRDAPGFVRDEEMKMKALEATASTNVAIEQRPARPTVSRMQSLVGLLQTRSSPALGLVVS